MSFICKRCSKEFAFKSQLKAHLLKKKICKFIENDLDRNKLLNELYEEKVHEKTYDCEYCHEKFNSEALKCQHEQNCDSITLSKEEYDSLFKFSEEDIEAVLNETDEEYWETVDLFDKLLHEDEEQYNQMNEQILNTLISLKIKEKKEKLKEKNKSI